MHRTNLFIVGGADLEYTKQKNTFTISWWMMLYWNIYIKNNRNQRQMKKSIITVGKLDYQINYFLNGIIQIIIQVYLFFR